MTALLRKKALIFGALGQDGTYLSRRLLRHGYHVVGTTRALRGNLPTLVEENLANEKFELITFNCSDSNAIAKLISVVMPDEIYFLSGQTSVGRSFLEPIQTINSYVPVLLGILEAVRTIDPKIRIYNAASSECFGDLSGKPAATSASVICPLSPYAGAKAACVHLVSGYRAAYGLFAVNGFLFNHESPLRSKDFVTQKIVSEAFKISQGKSKILNLGNIDIYRDWGWAKEYTEAIYLLLQLDAPEDCVICTGQTNSLEHFIKLTFRYFGLNPDNHIVYDNALSRRADIRLSVGCPSEAENKISWRARSGFEDIVKMLCEHQIQLKPND